MKAIRHLKTHGHFKQPSRSQVLPLLIHSPLKTRGHFKQSSHNQVLPLLLHSPLENQGHIEQSSCNQVLPLLLHSPLKTHGLFKQLPRNHILNNMIKIDGTKRHNRSVSLDKPLQSRDATETTTDSVRTWLLESKSRWSY